MSRVHEMREGVSKCGDRDGGGQLSEKIGRLKMKAEDGKIVV